MWEGRQVGRLHRIERIHSGFGSRYIVRSPVEGSIRTAAPLPPKSEHHTADAGARARAPRTRAEQAGRLQAEGQASSSGAAREGWLLRL